MTVTIMQTNDSMSPAFALQTEPTLQQAQYKCTLWAKERDTKGETYPIWKVEGRVY